MREGQRVRSSTRFVLAVCLPALAACGGPGGDDGGRSGAGDVAAEEKPGASEASARRAVVEELERYYADFSARDWEAFSDHFWPGATITTVWRPPGEEDERVVVTPVPEFVAQAPEGPGSREIFEEEMLEAEIRVSGGLAQVWARYSARFGDPGSVSEWEGTDAFTLLEHDDRWRIVSLVYAPEDEGHGDGSDEEGR